MNKFMQMHFIGKLLVELIVNRFLFLFYSYDVHEADEYYMRNERHSFSKYSQTYLN